jgi:hypothetical protein
MMPPLKEVHLSLLLEPGVTGKLLEQLSQNVTWWVCSAKVVLRKLPSLYLATQGT